MQFWAESVYITRYKHRLRSRTADAETLLRAVDAVCPTCDAVYLADAPPDAGSVRANQHVVAWRLQQECPDHAHAFSVELV